MLFDEGKKITRCETGQCGFGEMRIGGEEIFGRGVDVGEIAAAASGDENFLADTVSMFDHRNTPAALACFDRAEEAGSASTKNQNVEGTGQKGLSGILADAIRYDGEFKPEVFDGKEKPDKVLNVSRRMWEERDSGNVRTSGQFAWE